MSNPIRKVPLGLARVRKELPPPSKVFKDKLKKSRKGAKEGLRTELKHSLKP